MKKNLTLLLVAALSLFTSCEKEPVLSVSVKEISSPFSGNETSVVITANNPWVVQGTEWCVVEPASGEAGEFTVTVKVKPNETYDFRECEMKVSSSSLSEVIKVSQKAESVLVSEFGEYILDGYEQELSIPIQSNVEVDVTVSADWIQLKEVKGLETSTLIFSVQENGTESPREALIDVNDKNGDVELKISVQQLPVNAYLPTGSEFNIEVAKFLESNEGITAIKFIAGSISTSEDVLCDGVCMIKNGSTLEIHTEASQFMAHSDCAWMFYCDDTSFDQIVSIDFGENFNTESVTSMFHMFRGCASLESLDVSNFDTQNVTNMSLMFSRCSNLTSLDVSNFDTQNVTDMIAMFQSCSGLTSLDVSNFDTQNVTDMGSMFYDCSSLTSLDVSNFDTQNVTYMGLMFNGCSSLTSLDVNNFNTQNVTYMRSMFCGCSSLTSLDLSNFSTQNVTDMGWMFEGCSSLTSLDLSNFNTQNVTDMGYMFSNCRSLTSLDVSNFDTQNVTGMYYMFDGCTSLTSLDLSSFSFSASPDIGEMFTNTGKDAANKPIWIYVTTGAKQYIVNSGRSGLDNAIAKLVVEGEEDSFSAGDLGETDGGNW